jgi:hypothetical protein
MHHNQGFQHNGSGLEDAKVGAAIVTEDQSGVENGFSKTDNGNISEAGSKSITSVGAAWAFGEGAGCCKKIT